MKVVINATSAKMGGSANHLTQLLRHLSLLKTPHQFTVFLPPESMGSQDPLPDNIRLRPTRIGHKTWWRRMWWEQVALRRRLKEENADVLFCTGSFGMFRCPVRQMLLVRNALFFSRMYQDLFWKRKSLSAKADFKLRRWLILRSVRIADVVMVPTQALLDDLRGYVEVPPEKTLVNWYGVSLQDDPPDGDRQVGENPQPSKSQAVRLLYVSLYSEHKNLSTLLKALPLLNREAGKSYLLRTTVNPAWEPARSTVTWEDDLALARQSGIAKWVEFVGPLEWEETQALYGEDGIFVFPSLVESFGHPMAEAMAHGLPVVAADTPVNREVCGDAAVYFGPLDPSDLADKVQCVAANEVLWKELSAAGRHRAATRFRWEDHVARLEQALENLGASGAR